ncbi:hypothetical protein BDV25DRAFT_108759 [Aspergillus avenaceus]|uniref:ATP-grasp domain-containing protein n=1 Tax=Aspergillus avenaceus TaxID=36643 RepID=A0A5N6TW07_ASPAV|nr:hypothetical protein BDV25DRAFT_108759 [Aspergillus avenaceus]
MPLLLGPEVPAPTDTDTIQFFVDKVHVNATWVTATSHEIAEIIDVRLDITAHDLDSDAVATSGHHQGLSDLHSLVKDYISEFNLTEASLVLKLVLVSKPGFGLRANSFRDRLQSYRPVLRLKDRSEFGVEYKRREPGMTLAEVLDISVCMLLADPKCLSFDGPAPDAMHLDLPQLVAFPWVLERPPLPKKVVMFNGRKSWEAAQPILETARDLGIKLIILDHPGHWLLESKFEHLYESFETMDMEFDDGLPKRIVAAVQRHLPIDGIFTVSDPCLAPVAEAASILNLPTQPASAFATSVDKSQSRAFNSDNIQSLCLSNSSELDYLLDSAQFIPQFPLIVKPSMGWSSESVFKVNNQSELLVAASKIPSRFNTNVFIETYVDGPEVDANFVLCDGELLFFETSDDFPCPADSDDAGLDSDFYEQANILPSALPRGELETVRDELYQILLRVGFRTGVYHLEARIIDSSMAYRETDGILDLHTRKPQPDTSSSSPKCFLIEINARPPGFQSLYATRISYGIDFMALHLLACLDDKDRMRALSHPTRDCLDQSSSFWCEIVFIAGSEGGSCITPDPYQEMLDRCPTLKSNIVMGESFFKKGDYIPLTTLEARTFLAFFLVVSRVSRSSVRQAAEDIRRHFRVDVTTTQVDGISDPL